MYADAGQGASNALVHIHDLSGNDDGTGEQHSHAATSLSSDQHITGGRHGRSRPELLVLPHDFLEHLVVHHIPAASLPSLRATCRQLKLISDTRVTSIRVRYNDIPRHSFWRTCPLPSVASLELELPGHIGSSANPGAAAVNRPSAPEAAAPQPLHALLPPLTLAGLRRHVPGLRHLTLRNVHLPAAPAAGTSASSSSAAAAALPTPYPLDLSGLSGLSLHGLLPAGGSWEGRLLNPFPGCLGPALEHAAASLTRLSLSGVTFEGSDGDVLGRLTGLRELSIVSCNNHTAAGLTCLGALTRLTQLEYVNVYYKVGIPHEMVALSRLTSLAHANFHRSDFYGDEVAAWATWGPSLTRFEISSSWQMTLDAVPPLLPSFTRLVELDLPDHCLDTPLWHTLTRYLSRLEAARFSWVSLSVEDDEAEAGEGAAAAAAGGGGGAGAAGAHAAPHPDRRRPLPPHPSLRRLRLDGPWEGDTCDFPLMPLLPSLEELRVGEDSAALAAIGPHVFAQLESWPYITNMLSPGGNGGGASAPPAVAALRVLAVPRSWLEAVMQAGPSFRSIEKLRLLPPRSPEATSPAVAQLTEAWDRGTWRDPRVSMPWERLQELEVPSDLDAAALAPLCSTVRHLAISRSYGDALLGLAAAAPPGGLLPALAEVTLAGSAAPVRSGQEAEDYHAALLTALAARGVRVVRVTRGSGVDPRWWARMRGVARGKLAEGRSQRLRAQEWGQEMARRMEAMEVEVLAVKSSDCA